MRNICILLITMFIASATGWAQSTSSEETNKQATLAMKAEQKKERKKREKIELASGERQDRINKKPQHKKKFRQRKAKLRQQGIKTKSNRPEPQPAEKRE